AERAFEKLGRRFDVRLCIRNLPVEALVSDAHLFEDLDFDAALVAARTGCAELTMRRDARIDGYILWTVVDTGGEASVDYLQNQQAWLPAFFPLGETGAELGVPVACDDRVVARWSIECADGIHPDYRVATTIERRGGMQDVYEYASPYDETGLDATPLHRALWAGAAASNAASEEADSAAADIRSWLGERLPDYMVPADWVRVEALPRTPGGKLDRNALPAPGREPLRPTTAAPVYSTRLEADLANLWREILNVDAVDRDADFFDLGGDSIAAVRLTSAMQRMLDANVMLVAIFDAPTLSRLAEYLRLHHAGEVESKYASGSSADEVAATSVDLQEIDAPLSFQQQSFWLLEQLYPNAGGGNEQFVIPLHGALDASALASAWNALLERHEILRTCFRDNDSEVRQIVRPHQQRTLDVASVSGDSVGARRTHVRAAAAESRNRAHDLATGPLIDAALYRVAEREHYLVVDAHHIIADGLSIRVLRHDLAALYEAHVVGGGAAALPALPMQYREFAVRQRADSDPETLARQLEYWSEALRGATDAAGLPRSSHRATDVHRHAQVGIDIDSELADSLRGLARGSGATLFMTLLAAFRSLLYRYAEEADIPIGSPMTCRDAGPTQNIVGCMVNNVVFRTRVDGDASFRELLRMERDTALAAFGHSAVPFERVVETVAPRRRFGVHPLFQVLFLFDAGRAEAIRAADAEFGLTTWAAPRGSYWDLELSMVDGGAGQSIRGYFGYAEKLFDGAVAGAFPANLTQWLRALVTNPDAPVARLPMLDAAGSRRVLQAMRAPVAPESKQQTLHGLFEAQALRTPDRTALIASGGERTLTYRELDRRSNLLAAELQARGIGRGDLVGIGADRSPDLVIAILATLKVGAAYVPLDPAYPAARLEFIARDTGIELLLASGASTAAFDSGTQVLRLDRFDWDAPAAKPSPVASGPGDAAYVLYTSGSSGQPKGAIGQH
ncbi:MAG: condensation domain-containing protein, partial [Gammaproteobacteria bacterium]